MFTRIVEMTSKPGKSKELSRIASDKILPLLKKQQGFLDEIVLISRTNENEVIALSFWDSQNNAERYHREHFAEVQQILREACEGSPVVRTYDVDTFASRNITATKAA